MAAKTADGRRLGLVSFRLSRIVSCIVTMQVSCYWAGLLEREQIEGQPR